MNFRKNRRTLGKKFYSTYDPATCAAGLPKSNCNNIFSILTQIGNHIVNLNSKFFLGYINQQIPTYNILTDRMVKPNLFQMKDATKKVKWH